MKENRISLRPFQDTDVPLFSSWLHKDYILKWFENSESWLTEINKRHNEYNWIHHFIVMDGKTPIGFCQYYDCYDAKNLENWYRVNQRGSIYSIDYLIGNEDYLGKGFGKEIVQILTEYIKEIAGAPTIVVKPDEDNSASNGALLANDFIYDNQKKYYYKSLK